MRLQPPQPFDFIAQSVQRAGVFRVQSEEVSAVLQEARYALIGSRADAVIADGADRVFSQMGEKAFQVLEVSERIDGRK